MDIFSNIVLGLETALSLTNLAYCFLGVLLGTLLGVIPGIGVLTAISILFPISFHLDPTTALILLAGIWYGTTYGGSTASILLNLPGTPANAVTAIDGYPMARQGRAGVALFMTTVASFFGGSVGIILLMLFAPTIAGFALSFRSPEYFALMVMGLVAASMVSTGAPAKGLAMVVVGLVFGTVGMDMYTGVNRFTFGHYELSDGISLVALAMGIFGIAEVITSVRRVNVKEIDPATLTFKAMKPTKEEWRASWGPMLRGSGIGSFFGTLPGTGPSVAAFIAYAFEKRIAKDPSRFGNGAIEGIMAPEASNNASDQTAFIPTLALGIPGSASMAIMLGALLIHGIVPGPNLMAEQPSLFWGLIMSFWIGNLLLLVLNIPLIGIWVRLLTIPYHLLFPAVLMFVCVGTYTVSNSAFDVWVVLFFGALGYVMRIFDFPAPPLLLAFVLGPMLEENFRRTLLLSRGDLSIFVTRPITAVILAVTLVLLVWTLVSNARNRRKAA
ncbi:tripartite tricarboxylate transporter permease [Pseudoroseicyclus sp. CXY001]|uniref:tripartite tricarboxylate transporter permease n=1 Tax=Pseudoroseicyclus sp. CXY001 TaxID=3242492 RepID=UPI00358DD82F